MLAEDAIKAAVKDYESKKKANGVRNGNADVSSQEGMTRAWCERTCFSCLICEYGCVYMTLAWYNRHVLSYVVVWIYCYMLYNKGKIEAISL